ncbi:hypothetical protein VTL71DRAFT_10175 [Oculimacula yallundae]|uniref:Uncharacterized protein n=1 Tax=Oculimacula yallundae TaxID=86028 RepID=A0ABR4BRP4_9HELO
MTTTRLNELNNGIYTSWLPFTTPGASVPAVACSSAMYIVPGSDSIVAFDPWQMKNIPFASQCLPAEVLSVWGQAATGSTRTSLGPFHCPSLFTTATASSLNAISTSIVCCPSDYGFTKSGANEQCISTLKSGSIVPKSIELAANGDWKSWIDATVTSVPTTILAANVNGYVFAASTSSASSSSSKSSFTTSTSSAPASSTKIYSAKKKLKKKKASLGSGGIAGIVIAVVAIAAFIALFMILSRRKKKQAKTEEEVVHEKDAGDVERPKELATPESELPGDLPAPILGGRGNENLAHELDGGHVPPVVRSGA